MTEDKLVELKNKLAKLKTSQPQASAEVARLAELGDFSENAEYQMAKGKLRGILGNIIRIDNQINQAEIIPMSKNSDTVQLGHMVTVEVSGQKKRYQILGSSETNPEKGIISHNSPIGAALLDRKVGEEVVIKLANKEVVYTIIAIE